MQYWKDFLSLLLLYCDEQKFFNDRLKVFIKIFKDLQSLNINYFWQFW